MVNVPVFRRLCSASAVPAITAPTSSVLPSRPWPWLPVAVMLTLLTPTMLLPL